MIFYFPFDIDVLAHICFSYGGVIILIVPFIIMTLTRCRYSLIKHDLSNN